MLVIKFPSPSSLSPTRQILLDPTYPDFAERTIFVAGDRVTTDLLAQPFSMGRNLLCIYSKKHLVACASQPQQYPLFVQLTSRCSPS